MTLTELCDVIESGTPEEKARLIQIIIDLPLPQYTLLDAIRDISTMPKGATITTLYSPAYPANADTNNR